MIEEQTLFDLPPLPEKAAKPRRSRPAASSRAPRRRLHREAQPTIFRMPAQGATRPEKLELYERVLFLRKKRCTVYRSGKRQHHVGNRLLSTPQLYTLAAEQGFSL